MKPTISVAIFTSIQRQFPIVNTLRSLVDLKPDEVCILDTTEHGRYAQVFQDWLKRVTNTLNLPTKIAYRKWDNHYGNARQAVSEMCTMDWTLTLDSDEMLTLEVARDLRKAITELPPEALVLRTHFLDLIDDKQCLTHNVWTKIRANSGMHGRIFKTGCGKWDRRIHEVFLYPGRSEIDWDSPKHPKKDWYGYYLLHLWLYKANFIKRVGKPMEPLLKEREWEKKRIPKGVSWIPIL